MKRVPRCRVLHADQRRPAQTYNLLPNVIQKVAEAWHPKQWMLGHSYFVLGAKSFSECHVPNA